jgi:integrase
MSPKVSRPAKGTIFRTPTKQGTSYALRVPYRGGKQFVYPGGAWDGWSEERAQDELEYVMGQIRRGEWIPPKPEDPAPTQGEHWHFRDVAGVFLARQATRIAGGKNSKTYRDLEWRLAAAVDHLGDVPIERVDDAKVDEVVLALLRERERIDEATARGEAEYESYADPRTGHERRRRARGLSRSSINKVVDGVERVLREAKRRKLIEHVPDMREVRVKADRPRRPYLELHQGLGLIQAARTIEEKHRGLTATDVRAIRNSPAANVRLAKDYAVSDVLIGKIKRGELWEAPKRRNDVPRVVIVKTLLLAGPRVEHLCQLNREDLDLGKRRLNLPDHKTGDSERSVPLVPSLYEALMNQYLDTEGGPQDPLFPNRNGGRQDPDNLRARIVGPAGEAIGVHVTPHMLRRTFASMLAEIGLPPRRAMYLLGHKDAKFTMSVYQHVLDVSAESDRQLSQLLGCSPDEAYVILSGRGAGADQGTGRAERPTAHDDELSRDQSA